MGNLLIKEYVFHPNKHTLRTLAVEIADEIADGSIQKTMKNE